MKRIIEITLCLCALMTPVVVNTFWKLPVQWCVVMAAASLVGLPFLAWRQFDGGRHPCFLFLGMLLIFQGGRLLGSVLGVTPDPMRIEVATVIPLDVSGDSARLTLFLIVASALCVYFPCRLRYQPVTLKQGAEVLWLPGIYSVIFLTFPFALYKNLMYFLYIRAHGGYLAVFTDNAAVLQSAGSIVRAVSVVCSAALLIGYVIERRPRWVALLLSLYFGLSALDLLIGFRGKVFCEILSIWLLHNLKSGKKFRLAPVIIAALAINFLAVVVASYREDRRIMVLSPFAFVASQGISINVTEASVEYRARFARHGLDYVIDGFTTGINPSTSGEEGKLWTTDLTAYLNPVAARMGFGTASSYLAELYLLAGVPAVLIGSLAIGYCLSYLHHISSTGVGATAMALALPALIYLPRAELLSPLAVFLKSLVACSIVAAGVISIRCLIDALHLKTHVDHSNAPEPGPIAE